eukprot:scpid94840/ scgid20462/ 
MLTYTQACMPFGMNSAAPLAARGRSVTISLYTYHTKHNNAVPSLDSRDMAASPWMSDQSDMQLTCTMRTLYGVLGLIQCCRVPTKEQAKISPSTAYQCIHGDPAVHRLQYI